MTNLRYPDTDIREDVIDRAADIVERALETVHATIEVGGFTLEVDEVGVGYARTEIPSLIRASARTGKTFHIRNVKNPDAASALLMSPEVLARIVSVRTRRRTLGELLKTLPFKHIDTSALSLRAGVADNVMRPLRVPVLDDSTGD
jgi:hypothetical protein